LFSAAWAGSPTVVRGAIRSEISLYEQPIASDTEPARSGEGLCKIMIEQGFLREVVLLREIEILGEDLNLRVRSWRGERGVGGAREELEGRERRYLRRRGIGPVR
jgi:hypothetical protein